MKPIQIDSFAVGHGPKYANRMKTIQISNYCQQIIPISAISLNIECTDIRSSQSRTPKYQKPNYAREQRIELC